MNQSKISVRYAKALFLSAKEEEVMTDVIKDLKFVLTSYSIEGFREFAESPVVKSSDKKKLFKNVFEGKINALTWNFLELILSKKREFYLERIIRYYQKLYREDQGIKAATVKTPYRVTDDYRQKLVTLLENTYNLRIELEEIVDTDIIGGFIVKTEDEQFDASVRTALKRMEKKLMQTSI